MFGLGWLRKRGLTAILLSVAFLGVPNTTLTTASNRNEALAVSNSSEDQILEGNVLNLKTPELIAQNLPSSELQRRTALVIGNGNYQTFGVLNNPVNDANDMARVLQELGFEVKLLTNSTQREMEEAIYQFSEQLDSGGVGIFYYSGHGNQVNGENYLIPVDDREIRHEEDLRHEAVPLDKVLTGMKYAGNETNIIILDACRNSQLARNSRSGNRGLATVQSVKGTAIIFATAPGKTASDGSGRNGTFTKHLLRHIKTPNQTLSSMIIQVRNAVLGETNEEQEVWESRSLTAEFYFNPTGIASTPTNFPQPRIPQPEIEPPNSITATGPRQPFPTSSPSQSQPGTTLISKATGVNYTRLRNLLEAKKWKEADLETAERMLQATGREKEGWLTTENVDNFSCEDLRLIDQLWVQSSQRKFGISVQKNIFQYLGDTREYNREVWENFGTQVGWRKGEKWLLYSQLTLNQNAPLGHLPTIGDISYDGSLRLNNRGEKIKITLFSRANTCNL